MGSTGYLVYGRGEYTFLNLSTSSLIGTPGGNAYASFLVGAPYQILKDEFPPGLVGLISYRVGFFAQDDIKLTSKLTVNLGIRYEFISNATEKYNAIANFNISNRTLEIVRGRTDPLPDNFDFGPVHFEVGLGHDRAMARNRRVEVQRKSGVNGLYPLDE